MEGAHVVIVGSGNLSHALVTRWMTSPHIAGLQVLARSERYRVKGWSQAAMRVVTEDDQCLKDTDIVVLAVKPKDAVQALQHVAQVSPGIRVLLSVAAGVTIAQIRTLLPASGIVRTMPNICSQVGRSVTGVAFDGVNSLDRQIVLELLHELGQTTETPESLLDPMTALFGSGPAYVLVFLRSIVDTAIKFGMEPDVARQLALQMVLGTSELALSESHDSLEHIVSRVVSPGGTTEAMLDVLQSKGWQNIMESALSAAAERAIQLGALAPLSGRA